MSETHTTTNPKWSEREFLLVAATLVFGAYVLIKGDPSDADREFIHNLMLVATGSYPVSRGLAKMGKGT